MTQDRGDGVVEWRSGGVAEWRSGKVAGVVLGGKVRAIPVLFCFSLHLLVSGFRTGFTPAQRPLLSFRYNIDTLSTLSLLFSFNNASHQKSWCPLRQGYSRESYHLRRTIPDQITTLAATTPQR